MLLILQWLLTPIGLPNPDELVMERIFLGFIIFIELFNEWKKPIQTKKMYIFYTLFIGCLATILIWDLLLKDYKTFASAIFGIGLPVLFERFKSHFKTVQKYENSKRAY